MTNMTDRFIASETARHHEKIMRAMDMEYTAFKELTGTVCLTKVAVDNFCISARKTRAAILKIRGEMMYRRRYARHGK